MAIIFAAMVMVSHATMRRARQNGNNGGFFQNTKPAKLHDFYPHIAVVAVLACGGVYAWINTSKGGFALTLILASMALLMWQYWSAAKFWKTSISEDDLRNE